MYTQNRFVASQFSLRKKVFANSYSHRYSMAKTNPTNTVTSAVIMDGYYRDESEKTRHGGRTKHLGMDITGPNGGNRSWDDPARGVPVYAAIRNMIPVTEINSNRAYNKNTNQNYQISLSGTGDATLQEVKIVRQPWESFDDHSYGGIVGFHAVYSYANNSGGTSQFTLYIEYLHLITERFLPKNASAQIATLDQWNALGRGIGFGEFVNGNHNQIVPANSFLGPSYPLIGYLGATQSPHVHVQVGFFDSRSMSANVTIRMDPMVVLL
jgi:hypothetical protein